MPNTLHFGVFHVLHIVSPNQSLLFTPVKGPTLIIMSDHYVKCQIKTNYGLTNVRSF